MLPLAGVKVVEIAENLAGPYAGQILALMGADVLKVDRPGGGQCARLGAAVPWRDGDDVPGNEHEQAQRHAGFPQRG